MQHHQWGCGGANHTRAHHHQERELPEMIEKLAIWICRVLIPALG
jgi:hypothetical protein